MGLDLALRGGDLGVQDGDHRDGGPDGDRVGSGQDRGLAQRRSARHRLDPLGLARHVTAPGPLERPGDPVVRQRGRRDRVRCRGEQLERVGRGQVRERLKRGGEELPRRAAQPRHVPGPVPDQALVRPGQHLDPLGQRGVPRHRAQLVGVGAHHVSQRVRVAGIAFGPRGAVPLPVAGHPHRVDREHPIPSRDQRRHPRATVDPDQHLPRPGLIVGISELTDQRMQPGDPSHTLTQPGLAQPATRRVLHLHIMMIFSPVITNEQHHPHISPHSTP
jgi:hypothetical protein